MGAYISRHIATISCSYHILILTRCTRVNMAADDLHCCIRNGSKQWRHPCLWGVTSAPASVFSSPPPGQVVGSQPNSLIAVCFYMRAFPDKNYVRYICVTRWRIRFDIRLCIYWYQSNDFYAPTVFLRKWELMHIDRELVVLADQWSILHAIG